MVLQGIPISEDQCIGDSLQYINSAFLALSANAETFSSTVSSDFAPKSSITSLSSTVDAKFIPKPLLASAQQVLTYDGSTTTWVASAAPNGSTGPTSAKAWVNFDGTLATPITPRASFNVSSVTKNGTGYYTVNFATSMADANYSFFGCGRNDTDGTSGYPPCMSQWLSDTQTINALQIRGTNGNNNPEDFPTLCVSIFGN